MAAVVWTEPALADLDAIADYIALDNAPATRALVRKVFAHIDHLESHPDSGSFPPELDGKRYRQIVEPPCRVIYRHEKQEGTVYVLHVVRSERQLRPSSLHGG